MMSQQQPLFYQRIVSLNRETHATKKVHTGSGIYEFAAGSHLVPAVIDEFAAACRHLPIVFLPGSGAPTPVFLVGVRSGQNALVDGQGRWRGRYVPAFLRRYPFILGEVEGADPIVCVDEASSLLGDAEGEPLFEAEGESAFLKERIALVSGYFEAAKRTEAACAILHKMDLFTSINIDFQNSDGASSMHGLWAIDEARLSSLRDENVLELNRERLLAPIYAHLLSLGGVEALGEMAQPRN